jgi:hypothetical protein
VPDGWKLVPKTLTPEMQFAQVDRNDWNGKSGLERAQAIYSAILAAAPTEPTRAAAPLAHRLISSGPNAGRVKPEFAQPAPQAEDARDGAARGTTST